jgi:hypothetical protein
MSENSDTEQTYKNEFHNPQKWEIKKDDDGILREYFIGLLPSKTIINKERCGTGITTSEIDSPRNSIIVVPTLGIIEEKAKKHNNLIPVSGKVTDMGIKAQYRKAKNSKIPIKFIVTPESFSKITKVLKEMEPDNYLADYFVLLDECHSYVTERDYRNMGKVFKEFFEFEQNALVSATPIPMSDPRFNDFCQEKRVSWKTTTDRSVELVDCTCIIKAIEKYVLHHKDANCHVFCNSLSLIRDVLAILAKQEKDHKLTTYVFCSESEKNKARLGKFKKLFSSSLSEGKKLNFYTSKYFEGVDIKDNNAVVILATVSEKEHASTDINNKGFQAIFRVRNKPLAVYHLTTLLNEDIAEERQTKYDKEGNRAQFRIEVLRDVMSNTAYDEDKRLAYLEEEQISHTYIWGYDDFKKEVAADYFYFDNLRRLHDVADAYTSLGKLKTQWIDKSVDVTSSVCVEELDEVNVAAINENKKESIRLRAVNEVEEMYYDLADTISGYRDIGNPILTYTRYKELFTQSLITLINLPFDFRVPFEDIENATKYHKFLPGIAERFFEIGPKNALRIAVEEQRDIRSLKASEVKLEKHLYLMGELRLAVHNSFELDHYSFNIIKEVLMPLYVNYGRKNSPSGTDIEEYFLAKPSKRKGVRGFKLFARV